MDGSPSRGETIPIRLFLGGFDLTPTFREVNKKYSTRYYLSLVLIDEGNISNSFLSTLFQSMLLYIFSFTQLRFNILNQLTSPKTHAATSSNPKLSSIAKLLR